MESQRDRHDLMTEQQQILCAYIHLIITNWIMGKTCAIEPVVIRTLSPCPPRWICKIPILHLPRYGLFPSWPWAYAYLHSLSWLVVGISLILHRAKPRGGDGKYKKVSQEGSWPLLYGWLAPTPLEYTMHCLFNESSVCLSCNWGVTILIFQILATLRQEPRNIGCLSCN